MNGIAYPSAEFDRAVADVCHGRMGEDQARALNELLCSNAAARDEYLFRTALHVRLASDSNLFPGALGGSTGDDVVAGGAGLTLPRRPAERGRRTWRKRVASGVALTFGLVLLGWLVSGERRSGSVDPVELPGATSMAVAMLDRSVQAEWGRVGELPDVGGPMEPGRFVIESGVVEIVFYSGARFVIEGPADFELIHQGEFSIHSGRLTAEVAPQAVGFRVLTPHGNVTDLGGATIATADSGRERHAGMEADWGSAFGLEVAAEGTELQVFEGRVELEVAGGDVRDLEAGAGVAVDHTRGARPIIMDAWKFASLFEMQRRSVAAATARHEHWRQLGERLNKDPSLLVRLDFESLGGNDWTLQNACRRRTRATGGTVVGCQWTVGRWPDKQALAFQSVNDRVRLRVPGEHESLTLSMWVRVQGLDRRINSLFMSDGFRPGTVHWSIRNDGVLGLTLIGEGRRNFVLATTPPVLTLDRVGTWVHLAVVVDGPGRRVVQFLNGSPVSEQAHDIPPPYTIGESELGNWNKEGFPGKDSFLIRNFSGAMDEFCLFGRALEEGEIRELYHRGKPQPEPVTHR